MESICQCSSIMKAASWTPCTQRDCLAWLSPHWNAPSGLDGRSNDWWTMCHACCRFLGLKWSDLWSFASMISMAQILGLLGMLLGMLTDLLGSIQKVMICVPSTAGTCSPNEFHADHVKRYVALFYTRPCDHNQLAQRSSHKRNRWRSFFWGGIWFYPSTHFVYLILPGLLMLRMSPITSMGKCLPPSHLAMETDKKAQMSNQLPPESGRKQYAFAKGNLVAMISSKVEERTDVTNMQHTRSRTWHDNIRYRDVIRHGLRVLSACFCVPAWLIASKFPCSKPVQMRKSFAGATCLHISKSSGYSEEHRP